MKYGRYIYHYHAQYQKTNNIMANIDGIMQMKSRITSMDDYSQAKSLIEPGRDGKDMTVTSLSYIGREFE